MSGWYIMHRGWMDSFKPEPFTEREAFLWSIEQAAFETHDQWFNGRRFTVNRGEFVTSLRAMEAAFGWTLKRIRGFMERMGKAQKWAQRQAHDGAQSPTIITVCNYDVYQTPADAKGTVEGTAKGTRGAQQGHSEGTQQKELNNSNELKEEERPSVSSSSVDDGGPMLSLVPAVDHVTAAFEAYEALRHEIVPGARRIALDPDRRKKLAARLTAIGGIEAWHDVLCTIRGSPFLRGGTARSGKLVATLDWILKPNNLRKVRDGNYDEQHSNPAHQHPAVRNGPIDGFNHAFNILGLGG